MKTVTVAFRYEKGEETITLYNVNEAYIEGAWFTCYKDNGWEMWPTKHIFSIKVRETCD